MEPSESNRTLAELSNPGVHKACQALMSGNLGVALAEINNRLNREATEPEASIFWLRGVIHEAMGNYREALQDLLRGAALLGATKHHMQQDIRRVVWKFAGKPHPPWLTLVKAQCQAADGQYTEAISTLSSSMSPMAEYLRSLCYASLEDEKNATLHADMFMSMVSRRDTKARYRAIETIERVFREARRNKQGGDENVKET